MILKTNSNPNFILSMKLDIDWNLQCITILVILDNIKNHNRQMKTFKGNEFSDAISQYNQWEQFIF